MEEEAYSQFRLSYPNYEHTLEIDSLRRDEYSHLDGRDQVCLDYTGMGIFSGNQKCSDYNNGYPIGLSYTSANLATHAMYPEDHSAEAFFRRRILRYLSLHEDDYYIVFTASALSAFKLLGEAYPFHEAPNLLVAYDHACENVTAIRECARAKSAITQAVNMSYPCLTLDTEDLNKRLQRKRKMYGQKTGSTGHKGLFSYPYSSRITGRKNSPLWIPQAQENGWHVLLDFTGSDPKKFDSLGLSLFHPDFLICSFYNLFGEDPTGFGCLIIKKSLLGILCDSSRARAIGMVKIVIKQTSSPSESPNGVQNPRVQNIPSNIGNDSPAQETSNGLTSTHYSMPHAEIESANSNYCENQCSLELSVSGAKTQKSYCLRPNNDSDSRQTFNNRENLDDAVTVGDITCKGLDHADMLGPIKISMRIQSLASWLTRNLSELRHPCPPQSELVKIYSQVSPSECGSTIAFNLLDSTGKFIDPKRVQMLADRHCISIRTDFIEGPREKNQREESFSSCSYKWLSKGNVIPRTRIHSPGTLALSSP